MKDETLVLTPEKTVISVRMATINARAGAQFVDLIIWYGAGQTCSILLSGLTPIFGEATSAIGQFCFIFLFFALPAWQEATFKGRTLGKRVTKLRVVGADASPVTPSQAVYRNLLRFADFLPMLYGAGVLAIMVSPRGQRLGDMAAGTVVIQEAEPPRHFIAAPYKYGVHHFETHVGTLQNMSLEEYISLKRLCDRFPLLPAYEQQRLIEDIWQPFCDLHKIPGYSNVHPLLLMEAVVMKFGRIHHLV